MQDPSRSVVQRFVLPLRHTASVVRWRCASLLLLLLLLCADCPYKGPLGGLFALASLTQGDRHSVPCSATELSARRPLQRREREQAPPGAVCPTRRCWQSCSMGVFPGVVSVRRVDFRRFLSKVSQMDLLACLIQ